MTKARLGQDFVGSVSSGNMRELDVLQALDRFLKQHTVGYNDYPFSLRSEVEHVEIALILQDESKVTLSDDYRIEISEIINGDLWDIMNEIAPHNCYFGAHLDDGSDFGFWYHEDYSAWIECYLPNEATVGEMACNLSEYYDCSVSRFDGMSVHDLALELKDLARLGKIAVDFSNGKPIYQKVGA